MLEATACDPQVASAARKHARKGEKKLASFQLIMNAATRGGGRAGEGGGDGAQSARLDFGMHDHRLEFGTHDHTSTSAQHNHKFELESVGLVLGAPAGAAPSDVQ